jgi:hypothetical protein
MRLSRSRHELDTATRFRMPSASLITTACSGAARQSWGRAAGSNTDGKGWVLHAPLVGGAQDGDDEGGYPNTHGQPSRKDPASGAPSERR